VPLNFGVLEDAPRHGPGPAVMPWFDGLHAIEAELKEINKRETPAARARAVVGSANSVLRNRSVRTALVVGGTVALLLAGFALKSRLGGETDQRIFAEPGARAEPAMAVALPSRDSAPLAPRVTTNTREVTARTRADSVRTAPPVRSTSAREPRERSIPKKPVESERPIQAPRLTGPIIPNIAMPGIDSVVRAASLPAKNLKDSFAVRLSGIGSGRTVAASGAESPRAPTMPRLIGLAPVPKYPDALRTRQVEGQVIVQFLVDDKGRADVASMQVVQSPHDMLTSAVRTALPQFRFEPARTAPPESKARSEWVKFGFQFSATK
jgi:protein TonB